LNKDYFLCLPENSLDKQLEIREKYLAFIEKSKPDFDVININLIPKIIYSHYPSSVIKKVLELEDDFFNLKNNYSLLKKLNVEKMLKIENKEAEELKVVYSMIELSIVITLHFLDHSDSLAKELIKKCKN